MKGEPKFISGEIGDSGIDGLKFYIDDGEIYTRVKNAYKCRDCQNSKVFRLVQVKITKQTKKKWLEEGIS